MPRHALHPSASSTCWGRGPDERLLLPFVSQLQVAADGMAQTSEGPIVAEQTVEQMVSWGLPRSQFRVCALVNALSDEIVAWRDQTVLPRLWELRLPTKLKGHLDRTGPAGFEQEIVLNPTRVYPGSQLPGPPDEIWAGGDHKVTGLLIASRGLVTQCYSSGVRVRWNPCRAE